MNSYKQKFKLLLKRIFEGGGRPQILIAHTKYGDMHYDVGSYKKLIKAYKKIFDFNGEAGYYDLEAVKKNKEDEGDLTPIDDMDIVLFVKMRSDEGHEYEDVEMDVLL